MIIKGLFGRYQRWNPVHPTYGAFWGMGLGVGCGVGWGPGFGPEVIGYVGAGCGAGFHVGITLAGIGIGLPANSVYEVPYKAALATRAGALELARCSGLLSSKNVSDYGLNGFGPYITGMERGVRCWFSTLQQNFFSNNGTADLKSLPPFHPSSIRDGLGTLRARFLQHRRGCRCKRLKGGKTAR